MDNLTYDLRCLCQRNKDGSHATQAERLVMLTLISKQLKSGGFRNIIKARSFLLIKAIFNKEIPMMDSVKRLD